MVDADLDASCLAESRLRKRQQTLKSRRKQRSHVRIMPGAWLC